MRRGGPSDHRDHPLLITGDMGYRHHQTSLIYQRWTRAQNGTAEHVSMLTEITETLIFGAFHR